MKSLLVAFVLFIGLLCFADDNFIYSSGKPDGQTEAIQSAEKIKINQPFPGKLPSGKQIGLFLGGIKRKNLLLEIGFIRIHDTDTQRKEISRIVKKNERVKKILEKNKDNPPANLNFERTPVSSFILKYNDNKVANYIADSG